MEIEKALRVILLVEDHEDNRVIYGTLLGAHGFEVCEADGAEVGIVMAKTRQPALVLMDIGLPGIDGVEATRLLKRDPATAHLPIVALTAHGLRAERQRAMSAGVDGYLVKPVSGEALIREVELVLARQSARSGTASDDAGGG